MKGSLAAAWLALVSIAWSTETDDEPIPCPEGLVPVRKGSHGWRCGEQPALKPKAMPGTERTKADEDCPAGLYLAQNLSEPCIFPEHGTAEWEEPVKGLRVRKLRKPAGPIKAKTSRPPSSDLDPPKCPHGFTPRKNADPLDPWTCHRPGAAAAGQ